MPRFRFGDFTRQIAMIVAAAIQVNGFPRVHFVVGPAASANERQNPGAPAALQSSKGAVRQYRAAVALQNRGVYDLAIDEWTKFLKDYPSDPLAPKALHYLGVCYLQRKDYAHARSSFEAVLAKFPQFELAEAAYWNLGLAEYSEGQAGNAEALDRAVETLGTLLTRFPQGKRTASARFYQAEATFLRGKKQEAIALYQQFLTAHAQHDLRPKVLYGLGVAQQDTSDMHGAIATYELFLKEYPRHELAIEVTMRRADALFDVPERRQEAAQLYAGLVRDHSDHSVAPQAGYMACRASLELGLYAQAAEHVQVFLRDFAEHALAADVMIIDAECRLQLGQYDKAESTYRDVISKRADHPQVETWQARVGRCLDLQKKHAEALDYLKPLVPNLKSPDALADALQVIGESHAALDQFAEAAAAFETAIATQPQGLRADARWLGLCQAQRRAGDFPGATASAQRLIAEYPQSKVLDQAHYLLGELKSAAGDFSGAAEAYQTACRRWPDSPIVPRSLYSLGWAQINTADPAAAETSLTALIDKHADHELVPPAHYARATARQQAGHHAEAIEDVQEFLKSTPADTERSSALYIQGLSEFGLKQFALAVATFESILRDDADFPAADRVTYELAWALRGAEEQDRAIETFARLANAYPQSPLVGAAAFRVAEADYEKKQYEKAIQGYTAVLEKAPPPPLREKALHKLAWSQFQHGDFPAAQEAFRSQREAFPEGPLAADAHVMIAESLFKQDKYADALTAFEEARAKNPSSDQLAIVATFHAAQAASQLEKWEQSMMLLEKCAEQFPKSDYQDEIAFEMGWVQQHVGKLDEAFQFYEQVAEHDALELGARARFMIGEIQFEQKKYDEAVRSFFKVAYGFGDKDAPDPIRPWQANSMFEAARCLEQLDKTSAAKRLYEELVERFPHSDRAPLAKEKIAALGEQGTPGP